MIVISPSELRGNLKKYLDLAGNERIFIRKGKDELFELRKKDRVSEDIFFENPKNIEAIEEGISDLKKGKYRELDTKKTIWENIL